ncbi:MAG: PD40 domain-containing protein [Nitrospirae bacterium]|nr:PD40 domain-containing protein [Nitrospirota bacterium]
MKKGILTAICLLIAAFLAAHRADATSLAQLTTDPAGDEHPYYSPDGTKIVFHSNRAGSPDIWVMNSDGADQQQLTLDPGNDTHPAWGPDGARIVFKSNRSGNSDIWVMNADGSGQQQLTTDPVRDDRPNWSPDGTKIAFESERAGNYDIWVMNADGSDQHQITSGPDDDFHPMWSPDGTKIAFHRGTAGVQRNIWVMNSDGSSQTQLTFNTGDNKHAAWSRDGQKIAFESNMSGNFDVWVINADGSGQQQITTEPSNDLNPDWDPNGPKLIFISDRAGNDDIWVYSFAFSLTVDPAFPSCVPADSTVGLKFTTQAVSAGESVLFDYYGDFNNDGVVNGDEWSLFSQYIVDNGPAGADNPLTADSNPSSPEIETLFSPLYFTPNPSAYMPAGNGIMRVQNSLGETATARFCITPVEAAQKVTGAVYLKDTTTVVPNAFVMAEDLATENYISSAFSDSEGNYTLQIPQAAASMDIRIWVGKRGYLEGPSVIVNVPAGGTISQNLYLILSDSQITGTVTEYGTGMPLNGVNVWAETMDGYGSDSNTAPDGSFAIAVLSGMEWSVEAENVPGYFGMLAPSYGYDDNPVVYPPAIVNFTAHKETAWIEGTVVDEYGTNPVEGVLFGARRTNTDDPALWNLSNGHFTGASGQVTIGLEAGDWRTELCMNCHDTPVKVNGVVREMVPQPNVEIPGLATGEHRHVTMKVYYADGAIQGTVYKEDGVTPAPQEVRVWASTNDALNGPGQTSIGYVYTQSETDNNGFFRLPLLGGTWTVGAEIYDWNKRSDTQVITITSDGDEVIEPGEEISGITLVLDLPLSATLNVAKSGTGSGTVTSADWTINCGADCSETYYWVSSVTLNAVADAGSKFVGWTGCDSPSGSSCTVDLNADTKTVYADFTRVRPDLIVSSLAAPAVTCGGSTISVSDSTKNQGPGAAAASSTNFYLSINTALDAGDVPLGGRAVPSLISGAVSSAMTSVTIPAATAAGKYYVLAKADGANSVTESNETNNIKGKVIYIGPDLLITALNAPASAAAGAAIPVADTTKNQGGCAAAASTTKFYLSTDTALGAGDRYLGSRAVPALTGGVASSVVTSVTIPANVTAGTYYIIGAADAGKAVAEFNENNNNKARAITVTP